MCGKMECLPHSNQGKATEIANEVREKIIDSVTFRNLTGKRER